MLLRQKNSNWFDCEKTWCCKWENMRKPTCPHTFFLLSNHIHQKFKMPLIHLLIECILCLCKRKESPQESPPEDDETIELWKSLAASLKLPDSANTKSESIECATLFGKVVTYSLLQHDPKKWCYLRKKVMCFMITNNVSQIVILLTQTTHPI